MKTGFFISLLNPAIALVLASAFLLLWLYQRQRPHLAVLALAYAASAIGFLLQHFTLPIGQDGSKLISASSFTVAVLCLAGAIVARFAGKVPYVAFGILGAGGLAAFCWFMFIVPDLTWRICAVNFAFGGICLVIAAELRAIPDKGLVARMLLALSLLAGMNFLGRTLFLVIVHGGYQTYEGFYDSHYWTTSLLSNALLSLVLALALITAAVLDMLKALESDSRTDALSGLLNRRGFEERAAAMLERPHIGTPMALVLADLDHFKSVNDRFGHAAGDEVIAAFARHLRIAAGESGIVGRLGGEEFAVLLPASDLMAARLFAEGVRISFAQGATRGLPAGIRVTASFGIASTAAHDALPTLLARADEALYEAKKDGRDSVRASSDRAEAAFAA